MRRLVEEDENDGRPIRALSPFLLGPAAAPRCAISGRVCRALIKIAKRYVAPSGITIGSVAARKAVPVRTP
jgi:hypothetical protein